MFISKYERSMLDIERNEFRGCESRVQSGFARARCNDRLHDSPRLIARSRGKYAPRHVHRPQCRSAESRSCSLIRRFPEHAAQGKIAPSFLAEGVGKRERGPRKDRSVKADVTRDSPTVKLAFPACRTVSRWGSHSLHPPGRLLDPHGSVHI